MAWRKFAAVAVVVTGVLAGRGPAGAAPGKDPPGPERELVDVGQALHAFVLGEWHRLTEDLEDTSSQLNPPDLTLPAEAEKAREDILEEIVLTRREWFDLLTGVNRTLSDKVEEVRGTDPEVAAEQSGTGYGTAADQLLRAEQIATGRLRFGLGKILEQVREDFEEAGQPMSVVGQIIPEPAPLIAYLHPSTPNIFPMGLIVGSCDETATVLTLDPAFGQGPGIDESYIQFVGPDSPDLAAELRMKSAVDFDPNSPNGSAAFEFTGLTPGTYIVDVGVIKEGVHARVAYEAVTIPDWGGTQVEPDESIAAEVKKAGLSLRRFVKREGSALVKEVKAEVKRATDPDQAYGQVAETMREAYGRIGELKQAHRVEWRSHVDVLRMTYPDAADDEMAAGTGSSADRIRSDEQKADDLWRKYCDKARAAAAKAFARLNSPLAYSTSAGRTPHPAADPPATQTRSRSFFGGMWVTARCRGGIRVEMVDPRDGEKIERVFVEIREIDTRTLVWRREVTDSDVDECWIGLVEAEDLLQPGRTYDVRLVSGGDPPFATLDAVVITCPKWGDIEPPPPACTATSFTATIGGSPFAVPPFADMRVQLTDGKFNGMSARFANPSSSIVPQFNFLMSPHMDVNLADLTDAETVLTKPPTSAEALSYFYFPSQLKFTSEVSATYRIRNLRSFVVSGGCAEVDIDGVYAEWQGMTQVPFSLRLTMSAADVTR